MPPRVLYPDSALLQRHGLDVGGGHTIEVQEFGHASGVPALVLHGGPGSGCSPLLRRFFDPARFRIVCVDQRGAGASTPRGGTRHNTTAHLLQDLQQVRAQLGIERWLVVGGSWGAALALAHAADAPHAVSALLLRSCFLARRQDVDAFFRGAPFVPRLDEAPRETALAWWRWEQDRAGTHADEPRGDVLDALIDRYRVQSHYLAHDCFLTAPSLLERCAQVPPVPTLLLHGRADRVCAPEGAIALQRALPHATLQWIEDAGHDPTHPGMVAAMVGALDSYAARARFSA